MTRWVPTKREEKYGVGEDPPRLPPPFLSLPVPACCAEPEGTGPASAAAPSAGGSLFIFEGLLFVLSLSFFASFLEPCGPARV